MSYSIGPKIGIDGEAEFRKQIKNINDEYKALEAETKALTAAFEANGDEQGKLEGTAKILEKQITSQKNKLDLLEDALQKATAKYGENSIEAIRLQGALYDTQATLTGLEGELQDANRRLEETADGMEEFQEETEDAGDAALDFSDILGANFIADAALDALDKVIDAVVEFAKEMPEAASEVNAANSQFEQTFKELKGTAKSALQSISDDTGIAVTRMQESYTQLYAFTKSVGGDSVEALDIAGRAMIAAADNAAYYDKSIEEATEQLQSFIKGNYENDSALGISATETARNTKANELYAKSFNDLSEAQKVDVLLAMVEAGNAASGALGQAAREADSWTNVQGELDEAVKQFQATLGDPILKTVTPLIQDITAGIYDLIETADSDVLSARMDEATQSWQNAEIQFAATSKEIEINALVAENYRDRLAELEATGLTTTESQREYANVVSLLNEIYPDLNLQIDTQTGLLDENSRAQLDNIDAMKEKALYEATQERYTELLRSQADAALAVKEAEYALCRVQEERDAIEQYLIQTTGRSAEELLNLYNKQTSVNTALQTNSDILPGVAAAISALGTASGELTAEEIELIEQIITLNQEEANLNNEIEEGTAVVSEWDSELEELQGTLGDTATELEGTADSQEELTRAADDTAESLRVLQEEYDTALEEARSSIDSQIGLFDQLATEAEMTTEEIVANWLDQQAAFDNYAANLQKAVDMGLDQLLIQQLADGSEESMLILNEFVNGTETSVDEINAAFRGLNEARDIASEAMESVTTGIREKIQKIKSAVYADSYELGEQAVAGAVAGVNDNAGQYSSSMSSMAKSGSKAFKEAMVIESPSRVMIDANEDVVAGAVLGIERNVADYEAAMADLGTSGYWAYLNERADLAENFPNVMDSIVMPTPTKTSPSINYGGFEVKIYQQDGENAEDLAYRFLEIVQHEMEKREVSFSAFN